MIKMLSAEEIEGARHHSYYAWFSTQGLDESIWRVPADMQTSPSRDEVWRPLVVVERLHDETERLLDYCRACPDRMEALQMMRAAHNAGWVELRCCCEEDVEMLMEVCGDVS